MVSEAKIQTWTDGAAPLLYEHLLHAVTAETTSRTPALLELGFWGGCLYHPLSTP